MTRFLLRRLGQSLVALFGVMTLVFFIQRLTGDPTYLLVPETATQEDIEVMRQALGLDRALVVQYLDFLWNSLHLDFGKSFIQNVSVTTIIASRLPYTLQLAGGALVVAVAIGIPVGLLLGLARKQRWTNGLMGLVLAAQSMPTFWSGILMILFFGVWLGWLPPSGSGTLSHMIMPSVPWGFVDGNLCKGSWRSLCFDELSRVDYIRVRASGAAGSHKGW